MADSPPPSTSRARLISWNVASWPPTLRNAAYTHGSVATFFAFLGADVLALQEAKVAPAKLTRELACVEGWESFWAFSTARLGYSGTTTYARPPWTPFAADSSPLPAEDPAEHVASLDVDVAPALTYREEGRALETDHGVFVLINVYAPNAATPARAAAKAAFLTALRNRVDDLLSQNRHVVVVGDINMVADDDGSFVGYDAMDYTQAEIKAMRRLLAPPMTDAWRAMHPGVRRATARLGQRGFTCWDQRTNARARDDGVRIDFILVSAGIRILACDMLQPSEQLKAVWSDHAPLAADLEFPVPPPSPHPPAPGSSACDAKWLGDPRQPTLASAFRRAAEKRRQGEEEDGVSGAPPKKASVKPVAPPQPPQPPKKGRLDAFFKKKA